MSLIKVAIALNMEDDFDSLFAKKQFSSIEELIKEKKCEEVKRFLFFDVYFF